MKKSTKKKFISNVLSNYCVSVVSIVSGLVFTPYLLHKLGGEAYGLWGVIGSIIGFSSLADLGLSGAVVKYTAQYHSKRDHEQLNRLVSTALVLYLAIAALFGTAILIITPFLNSLLKIPDNLAGIAVMVFLIYGLSSSLNFPLSVISNYTIGIQRYDVRNGLGVIATLLNITMSIFWLEQGLGLIGVALASITSNLFLFVILTWFIFQKQEQPPVPSWQLVDWVTVRKLVKYGASSFIVIICGTLSWNIDSLVIGTFIGVAAVTPYLLSVKLTGILSTLVWSIIHVLIPIFSVDQEVGDMGRVRQIYIFSLKAVLFISLLPGLFLLTRGDLILQLWIGAHSQDTTFVLRLLAIAVLIQLPSDVTLAMLLGHAQQRLFFGWIIFEAIANLLLSIALVQIVGIPGAALGTLVTVSLTSGVIKPVIGCKYLGLSPAVHFELIVRALSTLVLPAFMLSFVPNIPNSLSDLLIGGFWGFTSAIAYLAGAITFLLSDTERTQIFKRFKSLRLI